MIKSYLKSIENLDSVLYDKSMLYETVNIYSEPNGQYFCTTYTYSDREFGTYSIQTGKYKVSQAIRQFKMSWQPEFLENILKINKKKKYFRGSDKFRFFFKYNGRDLKLVDIWCEECGYIKSGDWNKYFCIPSYIESSEYVDTLKLTQKSLEVYKGYLIRRNDGRKVIL